MDLLNPSRRRWILSGIRTTSASTHTKSGILMKGLSSSVSLSSVYIFLVSFSILMNLSIQVHATNSTMATEKGGRCPDPKMDTRLCGDQVDQCTGDHNCSGNSLCCSTGCNRVCILPAYTACEQVRNSAERRARSLTPDDAKWVQVPECDPESGKFKDIQCDMKVGCFCVDSQGFEIPGTRARSLVEVNCTNPKSCEGPMCRMLCPYGFELDDQGCEICECRNICKGVKCPGDTECESEETPCITEPCPPVASCKQPRSLESLCAYGAPLTIPDTGNPFLCGNGPGQPTCPAAFECNVKTGSDYGVCCASNRNFEKPGDCPVVATTKDSSILVSSEDCTSSCRHDLDCTEFDKCCFSQACGKKCSKPANSTVCLQQQHIAKLLSQKELEGKGYIPQCDENGNFIPKQCSRNGKVCWCVGPDGKNYPQSIGPSESVNCTSTQQRQRAALRSDDSYGCDKVICLTSCEFGFKTDRNGCPSCDCVQSPCDEFVCPPSSKCKTIASKATCLSDSLFVNPCPLGTPLTDIESSQIVACNENAATCPSSHICVIVSANQAGLCCPNLPRFEPTKPGMCPFLSASLCNGGANSTAAIGMSHKKCASDNECENSMKCCSAAADCNICADPLLQEDLDAAKNSPTMCQYLRDAGEKVGGAFNKFKLAKSKPQCKEESGEFKEIQCDETHCMCVDEYGAEIPGTIMGKTEHNLTAEYCIAARNNPNCLEMHCRLACDYGYETLDGCRICECRNPCMFKSGCGEEELCEMVDIDCWDGHCPPLPFCIPEALADGGDGSGPAMNKKDLSYSCPKGNAFMTQSNETLTCNPRARMLQCPDDYFCHNVESNSDFGLCCPIYDEAGQYLTAEDRKEASEELVSGNYLFGESPPSRPGQCPYLIPFNSGSCESECETDGHCPSSKKCCLNSCGGSQCIEPLLLTACQHQKRILEHKARESGIPSKRVYIPECDETGEYVKIQSFGKFGWCVDSAGQEIQGTRVPKEEKPNCQKPAQCPNNKCSLQCEFGVNLDSKGCPICECKPSPCQTDVRCALGEECRLMQLNCISEPCPLLPLCLPKLDNPCPFGAPLSFEETGDRVPCGSGYGSCPSSHKCNISPFGEYSVCCPKPKEVCFEKNDPGNCKAVITKWFFNSTSNECQPFYFSGCGGNNNQFNSKAECLSVCPALTHCERIREKNLELVNKYHHMSYIPKCDPRQGEWESMQCFEEVGMCWCVNKKGEPIKGTMTNGIPNCQARRGRLLTSGSTVDPMVCEPGVTVHKCNRSICENKICLGHPNAICIIDPCGGCHAKWISEDGKELDCHEGLGKCHREMQTIMNSQAWLNQGFSAASASAAESLVNEDFGVDLQEPTPGSPIGGLNSLGSLGNALSEMLLGGLVGRERSHSMLAEQPVQAPVVTRLSTKVTPIFADFGGHRVMGIMSSSVTIMGGDSSEENSKSKESVKRVPHSPVKSIADILADLMASQSQHSQHGSSRSTPGYLDDLIDLMPTSSHVYPSVSREMLPPLPVVPDFAYKDDSLDVGSDEFRADIPVARVRRGVDSAMEEEIPDSLAMESSGYSSSSEEASILPPPRGFLSEIARRAATPEILVSILPTHKTGRCPQPSHFALFNLLTGTCQDECHYDSECEANFKCCLSKCGLKCISPEQESSGSMGLRDDDESSPSVVFPSYEDLNPPTMVVSLSDCNAENGDFNPAQTQGELSWCVNSDGQPIQDTFTRGRVLCSQNGTVLQRFVKGPICPDIKQTPMVCRDQCLHSSCPLHPDAICVMDVCNECQPSFYNQMGEKVRCEEKCQQPPAEAGFCRAAISKYTYNATSGKCEEFIYGGCQGNDNNFGSMQDCREQCEKTDVDACSLPIQPGPCRASMIRWFFNKETQSCEQFDYGGCRGNANNFMTQEHCQIRCPDVVLCPRMIDGEIKSCSRTAACKNVTCPNHQIEDFLCTVDPCTCQAVLKDFNGNLVNCDEDMQPISSKAGDDLDADIIFSDHITEMQSPTVNNNEILKVAFDLPSISDKTRCQAISFLSSDAYVCDDTGHFVPQQCISISPDSKPHCFCVDDTGNRVEGTDGKNMCQRKETEKVEVEINFPVGDDISSVQLGVEMQDLLRKMNSHLEEDKVEVEVLPGSSNLKFVIVGDNKVDVSYWLEQMVIRNAIGVEDQGKFYPADFATSKFHHVPVIKPSDASHQEEQETTLRVDENEIDVDGNVETESDEVDVVSAERLALDDFQNKMVVLFTLVVAITAGLIVFGMFLAFQKKKTTGSYPKKPFESLAFSSQVYEIEKKVPKDFHSTQTPTFKVTHFVNEYQNCDENQKNEKSENIDKSHIVNT